LSRLSLDLISTKSEMNLIANNNSVLSNSNDKFSPTSSVKSIHINDELPDNFKDVEVQEVLVNSLS